MSVWGIRVSSPGETILDRLRPAARNRVQAWLEQFPNFDVAQVFSITVEDGIATVMQYELDSGGQRQAVTQALDPETGEVSEVLVPYGAAAIAAGLPPKLTQRTRPYTGPLPAPV